MLKNVVLPAPLGPMIETIDFSGRLNVTSLTAVRPPNCLVMLFASRTWVPVGSPPCGFGVSTALIGQPLRHGTPETRGWARGDRRPGSCSCRVEGFVAGLD